MELKLSKTWVTTLAGAALLLLLAISSSWISSNETLPATSSSFSAIARVTEGPFEIHVTAPAVLDAKQSITLSSELPSNKAKILYLATEGDLIREGEVVANFDPSPFEEDILTLEGDIKEVQASLMQATAEAALQKQDAQERKAELDYQVVLAGLKLSHLKRVEIPLRKQQAKKELDKTNAEFKRASSERSTLQQLVAQGLARKSELQTAQDNEQQTQALYEIAQQNISTLTEISFPGELQQAELDLENRQRQQAGFGEVHRQRIIKQEAAINRLQTKLASHEQALSKAHENLKMTTLVAPVTGIILYKRVSQGMEKRKPQVGDSLWNHHAFAVIPDMSSLVAYAEIDEKDIGKIAVGQATNIQPEAYTAMTLRGTVDSIGTLANDENQNLSTRYFRVRIALDEVDPRLRPGMSAQASILAKAYSDTTKVPLEAVFYEGVTPVVFLWDSGSHTRVELELGETDGNFIVVKNGLRVGQQVSLVYPDDFTAHRAVR